MPAVAKSPQVDYVRPELAKLLPRYQTVADCVEGQDAIKAQKTKYLPQPNAADKSAENEARYSSYVERAVFYNVTGRSLSGMVGTVFQKDPKAEIPSALDTLKIDVDGAGVGLDQQSKKALSYVLQFGRAGLLTDYPKTTTAATVADLAGGSIRPTITLWRPESIINWRESTIGGKKLLTLLVIAEAVTVSDDGFEPQTVRQFRVLRLTGGVYRVELWRETTEKDPATGEDKASFTVVETSFPTKSDGRPWDTIPFRFIGSENNDTCPDQPPLYDLAVLNIAHYRNSADYEEAAYLVGQPTPWASGLTEDWVKDVMKGKIEIGSRAVIPLPEGGNAGLLQVTANTLPGEAMERKEKQMIALGAKLVEQRDVRQTATEANQNEASETSVLATSANNVSAAYVDALKWACVFLGTDAKDLSYKLNTEFETRLATAADRQQLVAEWQANAITTSEMRARLTAAGVATVDLETYKDEIETSGPSLGSPVKQHEMDQAAKEAAAKAKPAPAKG